MKLGTLRILAGQVPYDLRLFFIIVQRTRLFGFALW
jgi:hypothetical protein